MTITFNTVESQPIPQNGQIVQGNPLKIKSNVVWSDLHQNLDYSNKYGINKVANIDAVKGSIDNILRTYPFERVMRPTFASTLNQMVGESMDKFTANRLGREIGSMITRWDNRVIVNSVNFTRDIDHSKVYIYVNFSILGYSDIFSHRTSLNG
jgi:hypothetical protein